MSQWRFIIHQICGNKLLGYGQVKYFFFFGGGGGGDWVFFKKMWMKVVQANGYKNHSNRLSKVSM